MPNDIPARVAVLEEIARGTKAALERIERRLDAMESSQRADHRMVLTLIFGQTAFFLAAFGGLLGVMAHGFHWL